MFRTIVWAADGSPSADTALSYAKELAEGPGKKLVVVHCKEVMQGRAAGFPVHTDEPELVEKIRGQVAAAREEGFDADLELFPAGAGTAAHVIAEKAREIGADVIVVGTRGHAPLSGLLLGSVTQRLLHIASCPVLAVPPRERTGGITAGANTVVAG
jgi:nucleotide-binding universal stress UspA family protein